MTAILDAILDFFFWARGGTETLHCCTYVLSPNVNIMAMAHALTKGTGTTVRKERLLLKLYCMVKARYAEDCYNEGSIIPMIVNPMVC